MEWRELNGIPIYLADVEVLAHLFYMRGGNMVRSAPHAPGGIMLDFAIRLLAGGILSAFVYGEQGGYGRGQTITYSVCQSLPMRFIDQSDNTSWSLGRSPVIFTVSCQH